MKSPYSLIIKPLLTEKSTELAHTSHQYLFKVAKEANKIELKEAFEKAFGVKVKSVKTMNVKGKAKRVRARIGMTASWKKAIVTLEEGNTINII